MDFSAPFWLFPLVAAPGLWLVARLYLRAPRRVGPALIAGAAWLLLALLCVGPLLRVRPEIWHPPRVILAVDASESYAALGARAAAEGSLRAARRHYEALGFRVDEILFAENSTDNSAGGTRLSDLRAQLASGDAAAHPNLRAVLLWSDGRFMDADAASGGWPAPLFPVITPATAGDEVQGESAELLAPDGSGEAGAGAILAVAWRVVGAGAAVLSIHEGRTELFTRALPQAHGAEPGALQQARIPLPPRLAAGDPARWTLRVRPASGAGLADNDTVRLRGSGRAGPTNLVLRPVRSLAARGLLDALRGRDGDGARAMSVDSLRPRRGDMVWVEDGAAGTMRARAAASSVSAPLILWRAEGGTEDDKAVTLGPDARLAWRSDGAAHLPGEALRLADLGTVAPRAPHSSLEPLAWAEENGRRGLLLWRRRDDGSFGMAVPGLWSLAFRPGTATTPDVPARWVRGAGEWARALAASGHLRAGRSLARQAAGRGEMAKLGADAEALAMLAARTDANVIRIHHNDSINNSVWPALPAGQVRERRARAFPLAPPFSAAMIVALFFGAVWVWRKRLRLD